MAKVKFRGGWTCSCVATSLLLVEQDMIRKGLSKQSIDIFQLGYRGDVTASAGTHDAGGCTDVAQRSPKHIKVWRECRQRRRGRRAREAEADARPGRGASSSRTTTPRTSPICATARYHIPRRARKSPAPTKERGSSCRLRPGPAR